MKVENIFQDTRGRVFLYHTSDKLVPLRERNYGKSRMHYLEPAFDITMSEARVKYPHAKVSQEPTKFISDMMENTP